MPRKRFLASGVLPLLLMAGLMPPLLTCSPAAFAESDLQELQPAVGGEWQLIRNDRRNQVRTYAKREDNQRIRSFRVDAVLNTRMAAIAHVLTDFPNYTKWYWEVQESRLLKQASPTDFYLYLVHRAPYGLPNRDVILHAVIEPQRPGQAGATIQVRSDPDYLPETPGLVRMPAENMTIRFTPLPRQQVRIEAEGFIDPGGKVPSWDANLIQRNAPYNVVMGFQRMVLKEEYRNSTAPLPFPVHDFDAANNGQD